MRGMGLKQAIAHGAFKRMQVVVSKPQLAGDWVRQPKFLHSGMSQAAFLPRSLSSFGGRSGSACAVLRTA
jgi:hypothetical protein